MLELYFLLADFFDLSAQAQRLRELDGEAQQMLMTQMRTPGGPFPWHTPHPPVLRLERSFNTEEMQRALKEKDAARFLELFDTMERQVEGMIEERKGDERLQTFLERHRKNA